MKIERDSVIMIAGVCIALAILIWIYFFSPTPQEEKWVVNVECDAATIREAQHCSYHLWSENSSFSLLYPINSTDCSRIISRCVGFGGNLSINHKFADKYNVSKKYGEVRSGEEIFTNEIQCEIRR